MSRRQTLQAQDSVGEKKKLHNISATKEKKRERSVLWKVLIFQRF